MITIEADRARRTRWVAVSLAIVLTVFLFAVHLVLNRHSGESPSGVAPANEFPAHKIDRQTSTETARAILPGIYRYIEILEGRIAVSRGNRKKEADTLRLLAGIAKKQCAKVEALGLLESTASFWGDLSKVLMQDATDIESVRFRHGGQDLPGLKASQSGIVATAHKKLAGLVQKTMDEGFAHFKDLYEEPDYDDAYQRGKVPSVFYDLLPSAERLAADLSRPAALTTHILDAGKDATSVEVRGRSIRIGDLYDDTVGAFRASDAVAHAFVRGDRNLPGSLVSVKTFSVDGRRFCIEYRRMADPGPYVVTRIVLEH